jgi:hypothetical protein
VKLPTEMLALHEKLDGDGQSHQTHRRGRRVSVGSPVKELLDSLDDAAFAQEAEPRSERSAVMDELEEILKRIAEREPAERKVPGQRVNESSAGEQLVPVFGAKGWIFRRGHKRCKAQEQYAYNSASG